MALFRAGQGPKQKGKGGGFAGLFCSFVLSCFVLELAKA